MRQPVWDRSLGLSLEWSRAFGISERQAGLPTFCQEFFASRELDRPPGGWGFPASSGSPFWIVEGFVSEQLLTKGGESSLSLSNVETQRQARRRHPACPTARTGNLRRER